MSRPHLKPLWIFICLSSAVHAALIEDVRHVPASDAGSPTPKLFVGRCRASPTIDGKIQKDEWDAVSPTRQFVSAGTADVPFSIPTRVRLAYDDAALYVAAECEEPDFAQIKIHAPSGSRDGPVWSDPCMDLAIRSSSDSSYQFLVNAEGAFKDIRGGDPHWNGDIHHAVTRDQDSWTVEIAIPWKTLDMAAPAPGAALKGNICRTTFVRDRRQSGSLFAPYGTQGRGLLVFGDEASYQRALGEAGRSVQPVVALYMDRWTYDGSDSWAWCRATVDVPPEHRSLLKGLSVDVVAGGASGGRSKLGSVKGRAVDFALNLRQLGAGKHQIRVLVTDGKRAVRGSTQRKIRISGTAPPPALRRRVRLRLSHVTEKRPWPMLVGIPIPKGDLWGDAARVVTPKGDPLPSQSRAVAQWGYRGSTRWLHVDFLAPPRAEELWLEYGTQVQPSQVPNPLKIDDREEQIAVDTGVLRFVVRKSGFRLFERVEVGADRKPLSIAGQDLYVEDDKGTAYYASLDKKSQVIVEDAGRIRATLRAEGWHVARDGSRCAKYVVRIRAHAGSPLVRVFHTFIVTADSNHTRYRNIAIQPGWVGEHVVFSGDRDSALAPTDAKASAHLLQHAHNEFVLSSKEGNVTGERSGGWIDVADGTLGVTTAVRDFRQNYPKEFEWKDGRTLVFHIWPRHGREPRFVGEKLTVAAAGHLWYVHEGKTLDFKYPETYVKRFGDEPNVRSASAAQAMGIAKTHEMWFDFHEARSPVQKIQHFGQAVRLDPWCRVDPETLAGSGVFGPMAIRERGTHEPIQRLMIGPVDALLRRRDQLDDFGMFNYGDIHQDFIVSERRYGLHRHWTGFHHGGPRWGWRLYHFTGEERHFRFAEAWSRHVMDLDMCHYADPAYQKEHGDSYPLGKIVGGMCDYKGMVHWHSGARTAYNSLSDFMFWTYYQTGYRRALDCAQEFGRAIRRTQAPLPGREGSGRGSAMIPLYRGTWDNDYLELIERQADYKFSLQGEDGRLDGSTLYAPFIERYWWWMRRPLCGERLVKWADAFVDSGRIPWVRDSFYGVLGHAYLITGNPKYLALGLSGLTEMCDSLYGGDDSLVEGDFVVRLRPGAIASTTAQAPLFLHALQKHEGHIPVVRPPFDLYAWRGLVAVKKAGKVSKIVRHRLEGVFQKQRGKALTIRLDATIEAPLHVRILGPHAKVIKYLRLSPEDAPEKSGRQQEVLTMDPAAPAGEYRLFFTSGSRFKLTAPLAGGGFRKFVWHVPKQGYWELYRLGRAFFQVPKGTRSVRLNLCGRRDPQAVHVYDAKGVCRRSLSWHTQPEAELTFDVPPGGAPAIWELRRGLSTHLQIRFTGSGLPPYVSTERDRFFIPSVKPHVP